MRDKHLYIPQHSELHRAIYKNVEKLLITDDKEFVLKVCLKFAFYFSLLSIFYCMLYFIGNQYLFVSFFIIYGITSLLFAFNFSHDFSHNTVFKSNRLNNFFFTLIYSIVGAHAEAWKQRHISSHHYAPNVEEYDSDLKITKIIRVIPNSKHYSYHKFQHIYAPFAYMTYSLFWIFVKDFVILFSKDEYNKNKDFKYHLSFWIQKIFYLMFILILPLLFTLQPWHIVLTGFILMHLFQSLFLLFTFFMTHHVESTLYPTTNQKGYINTSWLMNQLKSSNDMHPFSETANFILGGFNNHIAHHLFPHIHHIYYPKLNRILYNVLLQHDIKPNQTTYWGGVISHLKLLKRMSYAQQSE